MQIKSKAIEPKHNELKNDIAGVLKKYEKLLDAQEILAITAQIVGMVIAMQDQKKITPAMAYEVVAQNIEAGNRAIIEDLLNSAGGSA